MRSFRLNSGGEMSVWGWLLVIVTVGVEIRFISTAIRLGVKEPVFLVTLAVGAAVCMFAVGGGLLEMIGLSVFNSQKEANESGNEL